MEGGGASLRAVRLMGVAVLAYLIVLAWCFYLERMATQDSAFFSWLIIDTKAPYAALGRAGSWVAQVIPLLLIWMKAPLVAVLRGYSVSLIAVHALVFWLLAFRLRDQRATIALPIALVAGTHLMFYFGISELYQGLSLLLLVWALADRCWKAATEKEAWRWGSAAFAVNVWAGFYHQLLVLPLIFLLVYEAATHGRFRQRRFLLLAYVLVSWYAVRSGLMPPSAYEQGRMPTMSDLLQYTTQLGDLASTRHLLAKGPKFKAFWSLFLCGVGLLLYRRKWIALLWALGFSAAFVVLILVTDRDGGSPIIYENYYPVLAWCWAVVFADQWGGLRGRWFLKGRWIALALVLSIGGAQVWRGHYLATAKINYLERMTGFLRANGATKGSVNEASLPWTYTYGNWPLAFESALVSGCRGPHEVVTLFCGPDSLLSDTMAWRGNAFLGPNWMPHWFTSDHLNPTYFLFHRQGYVPVNTAMPDAVLRSFGPGVMSMEVLPDPVRMLPDHYTISPMLIRNGSRFRLGSLTADGKPLRFRLQLYDGTGRLYAKRTAGSLESDVPAGGVYTQGLMLERPVDAGRYRAVVELMTDEKGGTGVTTTFWMDVGRF